MADTKPMDGDALTERIISLVTDLPDDKKRMLLDTLIEWQQKEQRSDSRINCLLVVDFATHTRAYRDFMQDLSKGGVFIETREPLNVGETISLTFNTPNSQNHFKMAGKIVRSDDKGIGVKFDTKLSRQQKQIIKSAFSK